jgi:hypothetical protein
MSDVLNKVSTVNINNNVKLAPLLKKGQQQFGG